MNHETSTPPKPKRNQRVFYGLMVIAALFLSTEWTWVDYGVASFSSGENTATHRHLPTAETDRNYSQQHPQVWSSVGSTRTPLLIETGASASASATTTSEESYQNQQPLHVLFGLSGNHPGFFAELEVSLKSVLLHAPLERNLTIHLMADDLAHTALLHLLDQINITAWQWRSPIAIHTYNTQPFMTKWQQDVQDLCNATGVYDKSFRAVRAHTIGAWFRLFAHQVLPSTIESVVYMDVDVVITANLEPLARQINTKDYSFQWGDFRCSGFMVLALHKLSRLWNLALDIDLFNVSLTLKERVTDQLVFVAIDDQYPHLAGRLSPEWDLSIANGAWRNQKKFAKTYPNLGMIHYNGGGSSKGPFWNKSLYFSEDQYKGSLGLTSYYIYLPWTWARSSAWSYTTDRRRFDLQLWHVGGTQQNNNPTHNATKMVNISHTVEQDTQ